MAKITAMIVNDLSVPKIIGIGPIIITPPALTVSSLELVLCRAVPANIKIIPMKITTTPAITSVPALIMFYP